MLKKYSTDEKCREILTKLRWPEGVRCPRCKESGACYLAERKQFECASCSYQFSVTTGTVLNDTHLPLETWFAATYLLCEAKKGMSACQIQRTLGIGGYKTAWYLCHRIRHAMVQVDRPMLDGKVEMDETFIGGRGHGKGTGIRENKEIVIGIRQRGGELRFFHAKDAKSNTLVKYIKASISTDAEVMFTDEWAAYPKAMMKAKIHGDQHETIRHKDRIYVDGDIHTNTVESAFSLLKRGIVGTWHRISAKHLASYLEEMTFRFNRRHNSDLFLDTLRHMVTAPVLTFEKLTTDKKTAA
jgi:transposase-like protein